MKKLAVKFYKDVENPQNIPELWPAKCIEFEDKKELPDGNWSIFTYDEFLDYKEQLKDAYAKWKKETQENQVERKRYTSLESKVNAIISWLFYVDTIQTDLLSEEIKQMLEELKNEGS